ncbi:MAG TPA: OmpA family protein [Tepidisphaeraceae bacterium]|jgi:outer membrane protein OmpA-like peptidoglycan-associated protein
MAKGCKKCDPHELCEECPEWIFTLADLIMCMMGLFVILWVLKPGQKQKPGEPGSEELTKMVAAIREAFGHIPEPSSKDPIDMYMLYQQLQRLKQNGPGEKGKMKTAAEGAQGTDPEVMSIRMGKQSSVGGRVQFEPGKSELDRQAMAALDDIVLQIRGHRNVVMIKGHTSLDDVPETTPPEQKMDLSLRRAQKVSDYLTSKGVAPDILRVQGCSTFEPVLQRAYTPDGLAMNRRVEVEVTTTLVEQLQDNPKPASSEPVSRPAEPAATH